MFSFDFFFKGFQYQNITHWQLFVNDADYFSDALPCIIHYIIVSTNYPILMYQLDSC